MNKINLFLPLCLLLLINEVFAQDVFSLRKVISKKSAFAGVVQAVDFDKDGDLDVFSASSIDYKLSWYENLGKGIFGEQKIVNTPLDDIPDAILADLNDDGWIDIISISNHHEKIVWLKNKGDNTFSGRITLAHTEGYITKIAAEDVDKDGDLDVVAAANQSYVVWYENNGNGNFTGLEMRLPLGTMNPITFLSTDLDKDGDIDIISASPFDDRIVWNENDGSGIFSEQKLLVSNTENIFSIYTEDLDQDGDLDIISGSRYDIKWYENMGNEEFSGSIVISEEVEDVFGLSFGDLNEDGYIDIVSASYEDSKIAWYENDGVANFSIQKIITQWNDQVFSVQAIDLDNDGSLDILANTSGDTKIVWYENLANHGYINCFAFIDDNENGVYDLQEKPLPNQIFKVSPSCVASTVSDNLGNAFFHAKYGDYELTYEPNPLWELTSNSTIFSITLDKDTDLPTYFFGFKPEKTQDKIVASLSSSYFQCNRLVKYWLSAFNAGTTEVNGTLTMRIDSLTLQVLDIAPEPTISEDYKLVWNYSDLAPNQKFTIEVNTLSPGFEHLGDTLIMEGEVNILDENQQIIDSDATELAIELCSTTESNSKSVTTNLETDKGMAYIGDALSYTIQFYNINEELASNLRIEDSLDTHLDWDSFHIISASHNFRTTLDTETGFLIFHFDDINLYASNSDKREGSGYITYGVKSLETVEENSEVANKSYHFFDFNPPIITNTAIITLIEQVETDIEVLDNEYSILIYPNPFSDYTTIEVNKLPQGNYQLQLMDILGRKLRELDLVNGKVDLERGNLASGVYLFRILTDENRILGSGKVLVE
ncbi:MAG: FG-GAP-like repeat-containing protein [Chitinophagales bacterium]